MESSSMNVPAPRLGLGEAVDIEISVISAKRVTNPHRLKRRLMYSIELIIDKESKSTNAVQGEGNVVSWSTALMLTATALSNILIRIHCKHRHVRDDHVIGEASFEVLNLERNRDIEVELYDPINSTRKRTATACIKLHLKVALSVTFNVGSDTELDFRSSICLKQMEKIVGSLSPDKFKQLPPAWIRLFSSLDTFSELAQKVAELDSRAKVAVGAMAFAIKVLVDQIKRDERIDALGRIMCELYEYVVDACSVKKIASFEKTLQRLLSQTAECAYFITDYQRISIFAQRAVVNMISNADSMITNFEVAFGELKIALILGSSLQTTLVSYRILQTVERIENLIRIDRLPILESVGWDTGKICLRGTREAAINSIVQWASQRNVTPSTNHVYMLSGPTSCGKSAIGHSVAKIFHEQNRLGAAVFLHGEVSEANSRKISSSIIHQLAGYDPTFQARIAAKIKADQSLIWADIERQFRMLIVDTTNSADSTFLMIGPILIVIDNLQLINDEERYKFLKTIAEHSTSLPPNFRFLFMCRDDDSVAHRILGTIGRVQVIGYDDADESGSVSISQHVSNSLTKLFSERPHLSERHNVQELQDVMEKRARGMHFWVSTVYRSVLACEDDDEVSLFFTLLLLTAVPLSNNEAMDQLYHTVFKVFFRLELGAQHLFDVMIQSPKPMQLTHLRRVACISWESANQGGVVDTAMKLGLIVEVDLDEQGGSLFRVHPSLEDFLTNRRRCEGTGVYVDREVPVDQSATEVCIHILNQSLRYNICRLEDVMIMNVEIPDKDERIERFIPKSLRYACCNWTLHIKGEDRELDDALRLKLKTFMSSHVIHWIEVMSILGHFDDIEAGLFRFLRWLQDRDVRASDILYVLTADTVRFVKSFSVVISKAALQTYISALPLMPEAPESTLLKQHIENILPDRSISISQIKSSWNVDSQFLDYNSYSCSYGTLVALGSRTGDVMLLDARTKGGIKCNIKVHEEIQAMAFSPDGRNLVTVTVSGLVSIHDVRTGVCEHYYGTNIRNPFITYSNNCKAILIFDYNPTVGYASDYYLWDTQNKSLRLSGTFALPDPLGFALSPDGRHIAVPSQVGVKVIDLHNKGTSKDIIMNPDKGDKKDEKNCVVAWSPDGSALAIARGSKSIIRLWTLHDGTGWTSDIDQRGSKTSHSLTFSSDSSKLVFAQSYRHDTVTHEAILKIRIWDTITGLLICEEEINKGKTAPLSSHLSISPDGQQILLLSNVYSHEGRQPGWNISMDLLSDSTPAYMTSPPIFNKFKSVPVVCHSFMGREPSREYAFSVDADGWVLNSKGDRFLLAPYPGFHISTTRPSSTSTCLEIRHPTSKEMVLMYIFEWKDSYEHESRK